MNVWHLLNNLEEYLCTFLLSVMAFTVLLQVLTRFIFDMPLRWTEELSIYILAWVSFLGASVGIKRWAHIGVEAFVVLLPQRMQRYAKLLSLALCMVFFFIMFFFGLEMFVETRLGDAHIGCDLVHGHEVKAFLSQEAIDGIQDRILPELHLLLLEAKFFCR